MFWAMLAVTVGFLGLVVLGVLAVRVFVAADQLARQVTEAGRRISSAAEELEQAAAAAARSGADLR